jgi:hypothetical protein
MDSNAPPTRLLKVLYDFAAEDDTELAVAAGQVVRARGKLNIARENMIAVSIKQLLYQAGTCNLSHLLLMLQLQCHIG